LLVKDSDTLRQAIDVIDRNGLGLAFAVDGAGRYRGLVAEPHIRARLDRGGALDEPVTGAMVAGRTLPADATAETIAQALNGQGSVIALVDGQTRPVDLASPARRRKIPVAEPSLVGNELAYVSECITTNWISSQGKFVRRFEEEFARLTRAPYALATSNGTTALHLGLLGLGIGAGDEVIVPDLTFAATINTVLQCGAVPVIVDVDPVTWNIDPKAVEAAITPRTRAIMPVHLYGQPADMAELMALAAQHGLSVLEDAAEAAGSTYRDQPVGGIGHAAAFSFYGNKLITTGEGGMLLFRDQRAHERARQLRDHGMDPAKRYWHTQVGYNYRLTNLQAAIGCAQLERFDEFVRRKLAIARAYLARLGDLDGVTLPVELADRRNTFWAFSLILDTDRLGISRDQVIERLAQAGIESRPLFYPLHAMPIYRPHAGGRDLAVSRRLSAGGLSLPSAVTLSEGEIDYIAGVLRRLVGTRRLIRIAG
jgi:perosamine synthetase